MPATPASPARPAGGSGVRATVSSGGLPTDAGSGLWYGVGRGSSLSMGLSLLFSTLTSLSRALLPEAIDRYTHRSGHGFARASAWTGSADPANRFRGSSGRGHEPKMSRDVDFG